MYLMDGQYFTRVGAYPVVKRPVPGMQRASDPKAGDWLGAGHPIGVVFHYTVGCQDDIWGTLNADSFGGAQFNVGRTGQIYQYAPVTVATYHCFHESHYFWGIEHTAFPGQGCELSDAQLKASAALSASLVAYAKNTWSLSIPLVHQPNIPRGNGTGNDYKAGFHDHRDFDGDGSNTHTDHLYHWGWPEYLGHVKSVLDPVAKPPKPKPVPTPPPVVVVPPKHRSLRWRIHNLRRHLHHQSRPTLRNRLRRKLHRLLSRLSSRGSGK